MTAVYVCTVQATHGNYKGRLSIVHVSDVHFLVEFKSAASQLDPLCIFEAPLTADDDLLFDLEDATLHSNQSALRCQSATTKTAACFVVSDVCEWRLLEDAFTECQLLCNTTLRLGLLARDIYYAGIYSALDAPSSGSRAIATSFQEHILELQRNVNATATARGASDREKALDQLVSMALPWNHHLTKAANQALLGSADDSDSDDDIDGVTDSRVVETTDVSATAVNTTIAGAATGTANVLLTSADAKRQQDLTLALQAAVQRVECFYCSLTLAADLSRDFYVHPYVPVRPTSKQAGENVLEPLYMCDICVHNWKEYREKAEAEDMLMLEGEVNEELCSLCSDTPEELTLCGRCQRSFCEPCLRRLYLTDEQALAAVFAAEDWMCACCQHNSSSSSNSSNKARGAARANKFTTAVATIDQAPLARAMWDVRRYQDIVAAVNKAGSASHSTSTFMSPLTKVISNSSNNGGAAAIATPKPKPDTDASNLRLVLTLKPSRQNAENPSVLHIINPTTAASDSSDVSKANNTSVESSMVVSGRRNSKRQDFGGEFLVNTYSKSSPRQSTAIIESHEQLQQTKPKRPKLQPPPLPKQRVEIVSTAGIGSSAIVAQTPIIVTSKVVSVDLPKDRQTNSTNTDASSKKGSLVLPPVNKDLDDAFYFSQYVQFYENLCKMCTADPKHRQETDDFCFLCKDGGELLQCDHSQASQVLKPGDERRVHRVRKKCRKVYHDYCLAYATRPHERDVWHCPRHFCDVCGSAAVRFVCVYCPISVCSKCPAQFVAIYEHEEYIVRPPPRLPTLELDDFIDENPTPEDSSGSASGKVSSMVPIVCHTCLQLTRKCSRRPELNDDNIQRILGLPVQNFTMYTQESLAKSIDLNTTPAPALAPDDTIKQREAAEAIFSLSQGITDPSNNDSSVAITEALSSAPPSHPHPLSRRTSTRFSTPTPPPAAAKLSNTVDSGRGDNRGTRDTATATSVAAVAKRGGLSQRSRSGRG